MDLNDLRSKLTFTFIILAALPLTAFGIFNYIKGVEMVRDKAISHLESVVDKDAGMISRFVSERVSDLRLLAKTLEDNVSSISIRKRIITLQESYGVYEGIFLVDVHGHAIVRVGKGKTLPVLPPEGEWLHKALSGDIYVGEYLTRDPGKGVLILIAVPVNDPSRNIHSVLVAYVSTAFLNNILMETHIGETGEVYVLNKEGYFLTTARVGGQKIGQRAIPKESREYFLEVGQKEYLDYRGVRVIRASQKIPGQDWIVIGEQDSDEAFRQINALRLSTIVLIAALILITSVVGYIVSNMVVRLLKTAYRQRKELELQIIQKDKLASMGLLTAGIAHEINTPLANALLYSQLLKEDINKLLPPEHVQTLGCIEDEIRRGSNIVRSLLEFSRQSRIETTEVDVNEIITRLIDLAESQCTEQGIQIKRSLSPDLPMVRGDASVLYQVFMNIVANAVEAMENGGTLDITTRYIEALQKVKVEIQDTGPGIPREFVGKVFDPFFTTKKAGEGTGLGLAMSYGVVKKMGGNIRVMSVCRNEQEGAAGPVGTTFVVELPVVKIEENSHKGV